MTTVMDPFPEYEFEVGSRPDSDWNTYREFLHPSRRIYQTILNRRVLDSLAKHGDRHDIEREVTHWIYFQSPEERGRYLSNAVAKGYKVGRTVVAQGDDAKGERRFGLTLSRCHAVDFGTINDMVLELFDLAEECAGDYDGWETSVEKGE
jgi:regulator of RNase E activity RraB